MLPGCNPKALVAKEIIDFQATSVIFDKYAYSHIVSFMICRWRGILLVIPPYVYNAKNWVDNCFLPIGILTSFHVLGMQ